MAKQSRERQKVSARRIEEVVKAVAVAMVLMVLIGLAGLAYVSRSVDAGAPRSAVEYQLRRAQELIDADPTSMEAWHALGAAQVDAGMYARATDSLTRVVEADPENENAWVELGRAYRGRGDEQRAIQAYEEALKWAQQALAERRAELEAKDITKELVMPDAGARACVALAELYVEIGDVENARKAAQTLVDDNPMDAAGLMALAEVEEAAGNTDAAIESYRTARQYLPDSAEIAEALKRLEAE